MKHKENAYLNAALDDARQKVAKQQYANQTGSCMYRAKDSSMS